MGCHNRKIKINTEISIAPKELYRIGIFINNLAASVNRPRNSMCFWDALNLALQISIKILMNPQR